MIILMTLLIAGASMAFAVHQWRRGYHLIAIGFTLKRHIDYPYAPCANFENAKKRPLLCPQFFC